MLTLAICSLLGLALGSGVWFVLSVIAGVRLRERVTPVVRASPRRRNPAAVRKTLVTVTIGLLVSVAFAFITGIPGLGVVAGMSTVAVPWVTSRASSARRAQRVATEWPGVVDELISVLRSGGTVTAAMSRLAQVYRGPIAEGARDYMVAVSTTSDVSASLALAKTVWATAEGDRVAETLRLAVDCGGAGAMHGLVALARDIRRESSVRAEVRARAAWIRVAAVVGALAPWIAVLVLGTRPEGREAYGTVEGTVVLVLGYVITVSAYLLVSRIASPRRQDRVLS